MNFGEYLVKKRKELGLSQKDISDYLLISIPTISKWENNERFPDLYSIGGLAKLLQVDLESLLKLEDNKRNDYDDKNKFDITKFSSNFKRLRRLNGYSLKTLSSKLNVTYQTISKWENSETLPSVALFLKCAEIFKVSIQDLYYGKTLNPPKVVKKPSKTNIFSLILIAFSLISLATSIIIFTASGNKNLPNFESESNPFENKVSVTFDFDEFVEDVTLVINKGEKVVKYNPNIEGYDISYKHNDEEFNFDTLIYEDIVIDCDFTIQTFLVRFYGQYDELLNQQSVNYGGYAVAPEITSSDPDYVFYSWDKEFTYVKSDLEIYPIFKYSKADITFDANGGEVDIDYILEYSPSDFDSLPVAKLKGHTFLGWYLDDTLFTREMEVYAPIVLVAKYSPNTYKVHLNPMDGTVSENVIDVTYNTNLDLPVALLDNHDFAGWYLEETLIPNNYLYDFDHDIYLKAVYSVSSDKYSYRLVNNEAIITSYKGEYSDINLPETLNGYLVTGIDHGAFDSVRDNINSIRFHENIKTYEGAAYSLPYLNKIYVHGNNILYMSTLFNSSFNDNFETIEIYGKADIVPIHNALKNSVDKTFAIIYTNEGEYCNYGNFNDYVHSVLIKSINCFDYIDGWNNLIKVECTASYNPVMVRNCAKLESVILAEGLQNIEEGHFINNPSLKTLSLPKSILNIAGLAFHASGLEDLYLGPNIKFIGTEAFKDCKHLKSVYFDGSLDDWLRIVFEDELANPIYCGAKLYIDGKEVTDSRIYN